MIPRPVEVVLEATLADLQREEPDVRTLVQALRMPPVASTPTSGRTVPMNGMIALGGAGAVTALGERLFGSRWPALSELLSIAGLVLWSGLAIVGVGALVYFLWLREPFTQAWRRFLFERRTPGPTTSRPAAL